MISSNFTRCYHITRICLNSHYDTLGLSKSATHAEIKSAYYRLSMMHHPDRQDGNRDKFEKITNAYKVLGDVQSRKLYDRGAFQESLKNQKAPPRNYYSQTAPHVRKPNVPSGRTPIYDFDMWSRAHYGKTMERRREAKSRYEEKTGLGNYEKYHRKKDNVTIILLLLILLSGSFSYNYRKMYDDFDTPPPRDTKKENNS